MFKIIRKIAYVIWWLLLISVSPIIIFIEIMISKNFDEFKKNLRILVLSGE